MCETKNSITDRSIRGHKTDIVNSRLKSIKDGNIYTQLSSIDDTELFDICFSNKDRKNK